MASPRSVRCSGFATTTEGRRSPMSKKRSEPDPIPGVIISTCHVRQARPHHTTQHNPRPWLSALQDPFVRCGHHQRHVASKSAPRAKLLNATGSIPTTTVRRRRCCDLHPRCRSQAHSSISPPLLVRYISRHASRVRSIRFSIKLQQWRDTLSIC